MSAKAGQEQDETEEPTVEQGPRCLPENLIEEGFDPKVQPRTLLDILKQTLNNPKHKDKPIWDLGEEGSLGERACLMRVQMLQKALRHFVKYTRMEENLLSCAMIERGVANNRNPWNQREHLLHMARRNANLAKTRLSRLQMWASTQDTVLQKVAEAGHNEGLLKVTTFRPCSKELDAQILALRIEDTVQLAITLVVFRGAVVRNPKKPEATRVRTSKPIPVALQADYAKLLHCVRLDYDRSRDEYTCSCISDVLMVTPANTILGEVHGQVSCSSLRLHVKLPEASKAALAMLQNMNIPTLRENSGAEASEDHAALGIDNAAAVSFNDRSFHRSSLDSNCKLFLEKVLREYQSKGTPVEDSRGFVLFALQGQGGGIRIDPAGAVLLPPGAARQQRTPFQQCRLQPPQGVAPGQACHGHCRILLRRSCSCASSANASSQASPEVSQRPERSWSFSLMFGRSHQQLGCSSLEIGVPLAQCWHPAVLLRSDRSDSFWSLHKYLKQVVFQGSLLEG